MYMAYGGGWGGETCLQPNCNVPTPKASPSLTVPIIFVHVNLIFLKPSLNLNRPNLRLFLCYWVWISSIYFTLLPRINPSWKSILQTAILRLQLRGSKVYFEWFVKADLSWQMCISHCFCNIARLANILISDICFRLLLLFFIQQVTLFVDYSFKIAMVAYVFVNIKNLWVY